jgi:hypothetical protein
VKPPPPPPNPNGDAVDKAAGENSDVTYVTDDAAFFSTPQRNEQVDIEETETPEGALEPPLEEAQEPPTVEVAPPAAASPQEAAPASSPSVSHDFTNNESQDDDDDDSSEDFDSENAHYTERFYRDAKKWNKKKLVSSFYMRSYVVCLHGRIFG